MRNRLLNYRPSKARSVRVVDEIPREIYDLLVIGSETLEFRARPTTPGSDITGLLPSDDEGEDQISSMWRQPAEEALSPHHTDRYLETPLDREALLKRLFYIHQEAESVLEEQGYSVLYLALGFLIWRESPDALELRKAPLILVPVELERGKGGGYSRLHWSGEDIFPNVSLQAKLAEQGVSVPGFEMPDEKSGVDRFFENVAGAISPMRDWSVSSDISLDFFSFTKFVMYKDLDPKTWPEGTSPANHPLVMEILQPSGRPPDDGFSERDVDEKLCSSNLYHIMDADPSQIAVIEDVKAGRNLVVEGPPGTGKSQTIANIIAEVLASGKTVLFVSEKMAALEVVKARLDEAGLGGFCLELHSRKSNKKQVLQELQRSLTNRIESTNLTCETHVQLDSLRDELNDYARALREPIGALGHSPFSLFCLKQRSQMHYARKAGETPRIVFDRPAEWKQIDWNEAVTSLRDLSEALSVSIIAKVRLWQGCEVGTIVPADEEEIRSVLGKSVRDLRILHAALARLAPITGIRVVPQLDRVQDALDAADVVASAPVADRDVLLNDSWNQPNKDAVDLIGRVAACQASVRSACEIFYESSFETDVDGLAGEFRTESAKFLCFLRPRYRAVRRSVIGLYKAAPPSRAKDLVSGLERLADCIRRRDEVRGEEELGKSLFGRLWQDEESNVEALRRFASWIVSFRRHMVGETLASQTVELLCAGVPQREIEEARAEAARSLDLLRSGIATLETFLKPNYVAVVGTNLGTADLTDVLALLEVWTAGVPYLQRWSQLNALRRRCLASVAAPLVSELDQQRLAPQDAQACLEGNYADGLLRLAFASRPSLGQFFGELHEKKIERFVDLDQEVIRQNRKRLVQRLDASRPRIAGGASPASEAGILLGEFSRKRAHMPIRKLMARAGNLIQKIKPCFMMSPPSIAQFLDPRSARFDLIVFDEASQVRPEDALGALLRGNQVVVMGDTHQLPPTNFFDHLVEADDDLGEDSGAAGIGDIESILHQCSRSFPGKTLHWHYRSRHESLIAVSNQEFYENKLLIYPSPVHLSQNLGLQFVHLPKAVYDRGRSSVNREEARAVARATVEHCRSNPEKSLGVGAFNIKQQQAILEEIEIQLRLNPDLESALSSTRPEHFFVKNLETIQGDERDVIFLSIGFGFDSVGRLSLNFGPLNQDGGERRLNVLISRARERCVVFSNFRATDLALDPHSRFGLRALKVFLEYAETRRLRDDDVSREDSDSPFEDAVFEMLRGNGFEVRKQVGCAGFRVDLAVIDSNAPGRYLLGIECDGAKYHETPVARDRDRLRSQILGRLGWRIHRLWSTDWYRNRKDTEERLLAAIERARIEGPLPPPASSQKPERSEDIEAPASAEMLDSLAPRAADYVVCKSLGIQQQGNLHEQSSYLLATAVTRVVEVESPVHVDEVIRRIRTLWGLERSGNRIRSRVELAISRAQNNGDVIRRGAFLWSPGCSSVSPRLRVLDPPPRIEFICDEEIAEALSLVLDAQFAMPIDALVVQVSRVFGIQATSIQTAARIRPVIERLLAEGALRSQPNGMLYRAVSQGKAT